MRIHTFLCAIIFCVFMLHNMASAQQINDWENPDVNSINKEKPHAYGFLSEKKNSNALIHSLNGIWKFKWSPNPQLRPLNFYAENYSTEKWNNILVPCNWELQGFGTPIYLLSTCHVMQ
ncbi:MAG TPA: hypothetical protein VHP12_02235, partial [Chitinophagaceae bacterium]|nr:hypothetical protein [Chitinophagaceae bacterium]